eukprot:2788217-Amphidinium_carterae.1
MQHGRAASGAQARRDSDHTCLESVGTGVGQRVSKVLWTLTLNDSMTCCNFGTHAGTSSSRAKLLAFQARAT